jgi:hypothetical protein
MEVVELHQDLQLLTGSSVSATRSSYGSAVTSSWNSSEDDNVLSYDEYQQYLSLLSLLN